MQRFLMALYELARMKTHSKGYTHDDDVGTQIACC